MSQTGQVGSTGVDTELSSALVSESEAELLSSELLDGAPVFPLWPSSGSDESVS